MKNLLLGAAICLATGIAVSYATMAGQYSLNIHFVPPLVTGSCNIAQFWNPPNVSCALCFCITGSLSRCVPQPGCIPSNSTANPNATIVEPTGSQMENQQPTTETQHVTPSGQTTMPPAPAPEGTSTTPVPGPQPGGETTLPPAPIGYNLVRNRRRRSI